MRFMNNDKYRPASSGEYLCLSRNKAFHVLRYDTYTGLWNATCDKSKAIEIEAWAYLPTMENIMRDIKE